MKPLVVTGKKTHTQKYEFKKILTMPSLEKGVACFWADVADVTVDGRNPAPVGMYKTL